MLRRELVDEEGWVSSSRFNRTLAVYQVLPGPEAQELTIFFGTLARGRLGGLVAGLAFLLPGLLLMLGLSWFYVEIGLQSALFASVFAGCQAAVLALIIRGLHRIGARAVTDRYLLAVAAAAMVASLAGLPFAIPLLAGGIGYALVVRGRRLLAVSVAGAVLGLSVLALVGIPQEADGAADPEGAPPHAASAGDLLLSGLRAGALTFGGAYTAIPFVEDDATGPDGWMTASQFLDGLALSGIIPAPLIIFATFVGYVGGGLLGALAMTFGIFLPAFAITLVGHRQLETIVANRRIHAVLDGVTAAVVGLVGATILELAPAALGSVAAIAIFAGALAVLYLWQRPVGIAAVILGAGLLGLLFIR
jgi:chromate transporter